MAIGAYSNNQRAFAPTVARHEICRRVQLYVLHTGALMSPYKSDRPYVRDRLFAHGICNSRVLNPFIDNGFGICVFVLFHAGLSGTWRKQPTYAPDLPAQPAGLLVAHRARNPDCALSHGARPDGLDENTAQTVSAQNLKQNLKIERVKGIEPSYAAWEAAVLPLNYTRKRCQT